MHLGQIYDPGQLKTLSIPQLEKLAGEIRLFLVRSLSRTGGHLSSNLGVVETTLAWHYVFNSPKDKLVFDVGHQSYVHKLLTGRMNRFDTLRQYHGLSGFPKREESVHDVWEPGHSSTSISGALGMAAARDLQHQNFEVCALIGDGAIASGMALEALNDLGAQQRKMIVIFNDNNMSISKNPGGLERSITKLRTSGLYRTTKRDISHSLSGSETGKAILHFLQNGRDYLKHQMIDAPMFSQFDLDYIGPVDGHNIAELIQAFQTAKEHKGPVVVHVLTQKGKGYPFAEWDQNGDWHGVSPFDIKTGKPLSHTPEGMISWSQVVSNALCEMAASNPKICAITPAMANGSKLQKFARLFPSRFFDCGIAEEHAVTMAAGMAAGGLQPFVSIYSTFSQRSYDQISHDVARMKLPVVFGIDRAGLVGEDGETHQGIYDVAFMRTIPNLVLSQPKDASEARNLLYTGFSSHAPFVLRYPRGNTAQSTEKMERIEIGTWSQEWINGPEEEMEASVITSGPDVDRIAAMAREKGLKVRVINARFFKPVDQSLLEQIGREGRPVLVYTTDTLAGGLGDAIEEALYPYGNKLRIMGIADCFVEHGRVDQLLESLHLSLDDVFGQLEELLHEN